MPSEEDINRCFGDINVTMLIFIALSSLPMNEVISTRYGTIERINDYDFKLKPIQDMSNFDSDCHLVSKKDKAKDSIMDLFK